jgi:NAD(P)-dependent dehydrogenase (short-subunit alcohol dehydrogenase family)
VAARLKDAGAHVTAVGRQAVEHLAADEFVPADITSVDGTVKVIGHMAASGGTDIIVHVAGGEAWNAHHVDRIGTMHAPDMVFENQTATKRAEGREALAHIARIFES